MARQPTFPRDLCGNVVAGVARERKQERGRRVIARLVAPYEFLARRVKSNLSACAIIISNSAGKT